MEQQLLDANNAFYRAIRRGDYPKMDQLWSRQRTVTCTHPGWNLLTGRIDVMESWRVILTEQDSVPIWPSDPMPVITGNTAMVICKERIDNTELTASNAFAWEGGAWRLINHQAAQIPLTRAK